MMSDVMEIKAKADRLVELTSQQSVIKAEIDEIKAWFEKLATDDLRDTKKKTIDYWGSNNSKVVVGNSETVKPVSMTMVKKLLGDVFGDFVKEDTTYKMTDPCKRLFTMMFMGNYTEGSLDETIKAITTDEKIQRTLKKKLKGKYEKDTETLMILQGLVFRGKYVSWLFKTFVPIQSIWNTSKTFPATLTSRNGLTSFLEQ